MESRYIYNRSQRTIDWEQNWIHIGTGNRVKEKLIEEKIKGIFSHQDYIMLKKGRRDSKVIQTSHAKRTILNLIGIEDFELWDKDFERAIKFNKIEVLLKSKYAI